MGGVYFGQVLIYSKVMFLLKLSSKNNISQRKQMDFFRVSPFPFEVIETSFQRNL